MPRVRWPNRFQPTNLVASPSTFEVADVFGTLGGHKGVVLTVTDNNGTPAILRLTGPGNGTVNIGDNGVDLVLDQTTAASILTLTTKGGGIFALHDLTADSAIGSVRMPSASISNSVSLLGGASSITLASLGSAGGVAALTIGGGTVASITGGLRFRCKPHHHGRHSLLVGRQLGHRPNHRPLDRFVAQQA